MRYQYVVILKKNSERATDLLSILLCFLSAIIFLYVQFGQAHPNYFRFIAAAILIGLALNAIGRRRSGRRISYRYLLFVAAMGWIDMPFLPWISIFFILLAFLEYQTKRPLEIGFDQDRVVINTLFRQRHDWTVFNNIILKDGLLTLDFKSNRLIQKEVADDDDEDDADEEEFNAYCRERLAAAYGK
jgi:hypothetical protein